MSHDRRSAFFCHTKLKASFYPHWRAWPWLISRSCLIVLVTVDSVTIPASSPRLETASCQITRLILFCWPYHLQRKYYETRSGVSRFTETRQIPLKTILSAMNEQSFNNFFTTLMTSGLPKERDEYDEKQDASDTLPLNGCLKL